jgi:hypothetical protein
MALLPNYTITDTSLVVAATDPEDDGRDLEGMYYCVISNAFGAVRSRSALVKTQRLVGFVNPGGKVFHTDERVAFVQVLYSSDKSPFQWSITCLRKTYVCSNAGCPLHRVVSVVGRLLGFFALSFTYNDIKLIPGCTSTAVSVSVNTKEYTVSFTDPQLSKLNLSLIIQDGNSTTNCDSLNTTEECRVYSVVSSLTAVCQFDGSVPLLVKILHNAATVFQQNVTDHQRSLQHNFSNPVSSGIYQCIVTNPYGSTQTSVYAHVPDSSQV